MHDRLILGEDIAQVEIRNLCVLIHLKNGDTVESYVENDGEMSVHHYKSEELVDKLVIKPMKININGKTQETDLKTMSYEQLVELVGGNPKDVYSATFSVKRNKWTKNGMLSFGESVEVEDNMYFSVFITGNA